MQAVGCSPACVQARNRREDGDRVSEEARALATGLGKCAPNGGMGESTRFFPYLGETRGDNPIFLRLVLLNTETVEVRETV